VTAGIGVNEGVRAFEAKHDDYSAIMFKALADRLAEAFTSCCTSACARSFGATPRTRSSRTTSCSRRSTAASVPAPGYPACPDHTEKGALFDLLAASEAGMTLTESYAHAAGGERERLLLSHPQARYFAVDKIGEDQAADYARRKALALEQTERWLAPKPRLRALTWNRRRNFPGHSASSSSRPRRPRGWTGCARPGSSSRS